MHWLVNSSELYKKSDIVVDVNWFQEVTESAEDTVRKFLEVSTDQTKDKVNTEYKYISVTYKDIAETDGYDSDRYNEIDANDHREARDSMYLDTLVKLDLMNSITHVASLGIPLLIWKQEKRHFRNDKTAFFTHLIYVIVSS